MTIRTLMGACALLPLFVGHAAAQDEPADNMFGEFEISANVAWTTDYRWRGISFSDGDFAVQGGFDAAHPSGFYVGTWASSIENYGGTFDTQVIDVLTDDGEPSTTVVPTFLSGAETELDLYGGFAGEANGIGYDVGVIWYTYPGSDIDTDYAEVYGSVSFASGPGSLTGGAAYIWDQDNTAFGDDSGQIDNFYVFGDYSTPLGESGVTLDAHLGYTDGVFTADGTQFDWLVGLSYDLAGLTFQAAYVATDADTDVDVEDGVFSRAVQEDLEDAVEDILGHTAIFTVSKSF